MLYLYELAVEDRWCVEAHYFRSRNSRWVLCRDSWIREGLISGVFIDIDRYSHIHDLNNKWIEKHIIVKVL